MTFLCTYIKRNCVFIKKKQLNIKKLTQIKHIKKLKINTYTYNIFYIQIQLTFTRKIIFTFCSNNIIKYFMSWRSVSIKNQSIQFHLSLALILLRYLY